MYQERTFLLLSDHNEEENFKKEVLQSPLGLAKNIIDDLFASKFSDLQAKLDTIKDFTAGISSAKKFKEYGLAKHYPHLFAFHQFFHSSIRARQGKVLEKIIGFVLKNYVKCPIVTEGHESLSILQAIIDEKLEKLDIDALAASPDRKKIILIQLRSRDDTGGTTAKGSLVELLRSMLRLNKKPNIKILYLVGIWDERDSNQKNSTITKFCSSLKDFISDETLFKKQIEQIYHFNDTLMLQLAYGTNAISRAIFEWSESQDEAILRGIQNIVGTIENWDDLWIAVSIANLELELQHIQNVSNINILKEKIQKFNFQPNISSYENIYHSATQFTNQILPTWNENSLPFGSIAEKAHYIRDLVFLYTIHQYVNDKLQLIRNF
ncbi:hypothetical protein [Raineya orbicola]|nr:hypothetical protein [Raineya orbicola]